ncbi:MAG: cytochrome-c peroxidase, partial [Bacteroidota bacterium]
MNEENHPIPLKINPKSCVFLGELMSYGTTYSLKILRHLGIFKLKWLSCLLLLCFCIGYSSCGEDNRKRKTRPSKAERQRQLRDSLAHFSALPLKVKHPADNPSSPEKIKLGRFLFFDPILSGNKDVACATCHHPSNAFAESLDISIGVNGQGFGHRRSFQKPNDIPFTKRNSQTVINTAFNGINFRNR